MDAEVTVERDEGFAKVSKYRWVNLSVNGTMVGKARVYSWVTRMVIHSITVFPEFQGKGYGRSVVKSYQRKYRTIIADKVRGTARGFWKTMGFHPDGKGNYVWKRGMEDGWQRQVA